METAIDYINKRLFPDLTNETIGNKSGLTWKDVLELMDDYMSYKIRYRQIYTQQQIDELFDNYKKELLKKICSQAPKAMY